MNLRGRARNFNRFNARFSTPIINPPTQEIPKVAVNPEPETKSEKPIIVKPEETLKELKEEPVVENVKLSIEEKVAEPEPVAVAEPEPVAVAEPEPVAVAEPETVVVAEPETVAVAEPETVVVAEPETVVVAEPEPVVVAEPEPVAVAEPETVAVAEPVSTTEHENIVEEIKYFIDNKINTELDELVCWFDSSDLESFQSSVIECNPTKKNQINIWKNKSKTENHLNKISQDTKPIYPGFNKENGYSSILFNKHKKQSLEMNFSRYSASFSNATAYTQFIVFNPEKNSTESTIWSSDNGDFTIAIDEKTKELKISTPKSERSTMKYNVSTNHPINFTDKNILTIVYDGTKNVNPFKFKVRINNEDVKLTFDEDVASETGTINKFGMSMNVFENNRTNWYHGNINEVIIYKSSLDNNSCVEMETYLKEKWGL